MGHHRRPTARRTNQFSLSPDWLIRYLAGPLDASSPRFLTKGAHGHFLRRSGVEKPAKFCARATHGTKAMSSPVSIGGSAQPICCVKSLRPLAATPSPCSSSTSCSMVGVPPEGYLIWSFCRAIRFASPHFQAVLVISSISSRSKARPIASVMTRSIGSIYCLATE